MTPKVTGRPGYAPTDLLKLYIYGYLNRVRSSRGLAPTASFAREAVLDRMQARLVKCPGILDRRRESVEHPFGTIKQWMNQGAFLMRGLEKVRGEFSLTALAYNVTWITQTRAGQGGERGRRRVFLRCVRSGSLATVRGSRNTREITFGCP